MTLEALGILNELLGFRHFRDFKFKINLALFLICVLVGVPHTLSEGFSVCE